MPATDSLAPKRLLCATDFSDAASAALDVAVVLARSLQAEIRIVHVRPAPEASGRPMACAMHAPGIDASSETEILHDLDRWGQVALASGMAARSVLLGGDPPDEIVREAQHTVADIIVLGRHHRDASNPWTRGSVAERVVRTASCPVVVVSSFPHHRGTRLRHLLCAIDLGETSASTLQYALGLTSALPADLLVLHVAANEAERVRSALAAVVASASATSGRIHESVATGAPYQEILTAARENDTDMIVVGSHGGGVADRQFLGSTTLHLLRQAEWPILVVPAHLSQTRGQLEPPGRVARRVGGDAARHRPGGHGAPSGRG